MSKPNINKSGILLLLFVFSCNTEKQDPIYEICNCAGKDERLINSDWGVVALSRDGYKLIGIKTGLITPCKDIPIDLQVDGQLIIFSGRRVVGCERKYKGYGVITQLAEISRIQKIDVFYSDNDLRIALIKTEDVGAEAGFGYDLYSAKRDFHVVQDQIPNGQRKEPFKTATDAIKIAYLNGHLLYNFGPFNGASFGYLYFLKIYNEA